MKRVLIDEATEHWDSGNPLLAGRVLFEHIPTQHRVAWATEILQLCSTLVELPSAAYELTVLANTPTSWHRAHMCFDALRRQALECDKSNCPPLFREVLRLAENVAKVMCNAASERANFDASSGWRLVDNLRSIVDLSGDDDFARQAWYVASCEAFASPRAG